jgi:uncharacterized protein GlcG (DUF336 family)
MNIRRRQVGDPRGGERRRFPIVVDGKLIGAIGASGGIFTQDAVVAKAGLAAMATH